MTGRKMEEQIIELLRQRGDYVSGQELCGMLGVSRTAVWKHISILREEGYEITSVQNRGYCLMEEPDVTDAFHIQRYMETKWLGRQICYEKETGSTNTLAKRLGEQDAVDGTVVVAERQTAGKGRRGHAWFSPEGNCYFSVLLRPQLRTEQAASVTLVAALALAQTVTEVAGLDARIKWPNDVVVNGKKLCGILTESSIEPEFINYIVVGIGINVNQTEFSEELKDKATSIFLETGVKQDRAKALGCFLEKFEALYETFLEAGDLSGLRETYNSLLVNCGKEVRIVDREAERRLLAVGIDDSGRLIVEHENGEREAILSGEVSVRGLYGYV